ncbi:MAG: 1-deoxy-D-xylulose-5-phosphate reductoisomerase, partial [Bacteroidales bacterium]|nr:1-deoxy-D-xylulose-5-phosphate reductoisomerase [Bacteroidales bacterium]
TGNIGQQALDVLSHNPDYFELKLISAKNNARLLIQQAKKHRPHAVYLAENKSIQYVQSALKAENIIVYTTEKELFDSFLQEDLHLVLIAIVGFAGLAPTLAAIHAKKDIALANKESLVVGGEFVMENAKRNQVNIIPIDSEHSAIFQCLLGEESSNIEKVILTASGGPFRAFSKKDIEKVSLEQALNHPTWNMGPKVSIDSASMMNKGLELIEAKHLFQLKPEQLEVIIHPQSVVHSMVQFTDGSTKALMSPPDMKGPIQFSMFYPQRMKSSLTNLNLFDYPSLSFHRVDTKKFRNLALAFDALKKGGNMPAILNAANEAAVEAVLNKTLSFHQISEVVETMMSQINFVTNASLSDLQYSHHETFNKSKELIKRIN